jgi:curved DNA-binding protein CbpA
MINYYDLLEIPNTAATHDIKIAYRKLAQKHHPDRCHTTEAEEMMKLINEAKDILLNVHRRMEYDEQLKSFNKFKKRQQKEAQAKRDTQARAEKEARAKRDTQARAEKEAQAKRDAQAKAEKEAQAKRDAQAKAEKEAQAKRDAQAKAEKEAQAKRDTQARAEKEAKAKINARKKVFFLALLTIGVTFFYLNIKSPPVTAENIDSTTAENIDSTTAENIDSTTAENIDSATAENIDSPTESIRDNHLVLAKKNDSKKITTQYNSSYKIQNNQKDIDYKSHSIEKNTNSISNESREINDFKQPAKNEKQSLDLSNESFM